MKKKWVNHKKIGALLMSFALISAGLPVGVSAEDLLTSGEETGYETDYTAMGESTDVWEGTEDLTTEISEASDLNSEESAQTGLETSNLDQEVGSQSASETASGEGAIEETTEDSADVFFFAESSEDAAGEGESSSTESLANGAEESEEELLLLEDGDALEDAEAAEVGADSGTCGNDLTWTYADGVLTITGSGSMTSEPWRNSYLSSIKKVIIGGKTTSIDSSAFRGCSNLETVVLGNYVTTIGNYAFENCSSLKNITLPDSLTYIGYSAFKGCTSLTEITIPSSVTYLGSAAFSQSGLTSITIPASVERILMSLCLGCESLKSVYISSGITAIGEYAFQECSNLETVTIPDSVTSISGSAFKECTSLKSIRIPSQMTYFGANVFQDCTSLTSVSLPDGFTDISQAAFSGCTSLANINIPSTVTEFGYYCFQNCTSLTKISIPSGTYGIGLYAFSGCTGITKVSIPASVKLIREYAFSGCSGLTDVYYESSQADWNEIQIDSDNIYLTTAAIHYKSTMPLDKPVLASPTLTATGVKLTWGAVSGAVKYRVFYRVSGASSWTKAADTTSTSYQVTGLTSGKTYQFTVRCVNSAGTSFASDSAAAKSIQYIATPVISSLTLGTTGVNVKWSAVSGAAKYRVFYKQSGATSWTKAGDTTSTAYTVGSLNSGKTYYFTVRCVNAAGTAFTSGLNSTGSSIRFVKAPVLSSVQNTATGATLKWQASSGATKYRVFYKVSGASSWTKAGDTTGTSYTVNGLVSGKTYIFTARCLNTAGTSFTSNFYSAGKSIVFLSRPSVSAAQATKGVKVTWSKVTGATGYAVYRKVSGGSWAKIKTISSGSTVSYTDTTGTSGTRYYYTVRATKGSSLSAYVTAGASAIAK